MFRDIRLGDDIDDYCVRCKRVMNHAVVSVVNGVAAKVRCRTCHNDHDFRHEQPPPPKADSRKAALFNEVLKHVDPAAAETDAADPPEIEADETGISEPEVVEAEADAEEAPKAMAATEPPAAKSAAKSSIKATARNGAKAAAKTKPKAKK